MNERLGKGDAADCAHKTLKKQMVGDRIWFVCECGQKFLAQPWDGKMRVLPAAAPEKAEGRDEQEILLLPRKDFDKLGDGYVRLSDVLRILRASALAARTGPEEK